MGASSYNFDAFLGHSKLGFISADRLRKTAFMAFEVPAAANGFQSPAALATDRRAVALARRWLPSSRRGLFFLVALAPTFFATLYYGLIASNRFVSELEFVCSQRFEPPGHWPGNAVSDFRTRAPRTTATQYKAISPSRDAVRALEKRLSLRKMFGRDGVDLFARFPHFSGAAIYSSVFTIIILKRVSVIQDPTKGIAVLRVIAFDPSDAQQIATELLQLGEEMVNRLNARAQKDAISSSLVEMANAEKRTLEAQIKLREFRNKEGLVDPAKTRPPCLKPSRRCRRNSRTTWLKPAN